MREKRYKNTKSQTNFSMQNSRKIAEFKCKFTTFAKSFFIVELPNYLFSRNVCCAHIYGGVYP